jgi:hypothetical protein
LLRWRLDVSANPARCVDPAGRGDNGALVLGCVVVIALLGVTVRFILDFAGVAVRFAQARIGVGVRFVCFLFLVPLASIHRSVVLVLIGVGVRVLVLLLILILDVDVELFGKPAGPPPTLQGVIAGATREVCLEIVRANEIFNVEKCRPFHANVDEGGLHAWQNSGDFPEHYVANGAPSTLTLEVKLCDDPVLDEAHAGLSEIAIDDENVSCH